MKIVDDARMAIAQLSGPGLARLQSRFPQALWSGPGDRRQLALTFDDGPDARDTPQLLEALARHQVSATFFQIGQRAEQQPALVRMVAAAGHQIAMHGYYHHPFPLQAPLALRAQLVRTQRLIAAASGRVPSSVRDVRPPYGVVTPATLAALTAWGYRPVMWSVVPFHWLQPAEPTIEQTVRHASAGSVLVLHERLAGPPVAALVAAIVPRLLEAGFEFVSVDQMWRQREACAADQDA